MTAVGVIPARYGASRFPGKPLAKIAGLPMLQRVWQGTRRARSLRTVIVATDDERIAAAAREVHVEAAMTPGELASGTDRVALIAETIETDVVLNVQGDEPLIDPQELGQVLAEFQSLDADFGTVRCAIADTADLWDPNIVKVVIDAGGRALYFSRAPIPFPRQAWLQADNEAGAPRLDFRVSAVDTGYWQHVGVYLYRRPALARWARIPASRLEQTEGLEQLRILEAGEAIQTFPINESVPGVDTPEDLERVRRYVAGR